MHTFFDVNDRPCTQAEAHMVVVARESEWDASSRARALTLGEYEDGACPCGCGQQMSVSHEPGTVYFVDTWKCAAGAAIEKQRRADEAAARESGKGEGWDDGVHYYARVPTQRELAADPRTARLAKNAGTRLEQIRSRPRRTRPGVTDGD